MSSRDRAPATYPPWFSREPQRVRPAPALQPTPLPPPPEPIVVESTPVPAEASGVFRSAAPIEVDEAPQEPLPSANEIAELTSELESVREENAQLRDALLAQVSAFVGERVRLVRDAEEKVVRLALAIAENIVSEHLAVQPETVLAWVHEGIVTLAAEERLVIAVSPIVMERVPTHAWHAVTSEGHKVEVDPALTGFACEIRSNHGLLEQSVRSRTQAVCAALGVDEA